MNTNSTVSSLEVELQVSNWIVAVRLRDQVATGELWRYCEKRLHGICQSQLTLRRCSGIEDADDIANQVFGSFVGKIQRGDLTGIVTAGGCWAILTKFAKDACCDAARRYWRVQSRIEIHECSAWDKKSCTDATFDRIDERDWFDMRLSSFTADVRRIVSLAIAGKTYREIGRQLQLAPSTVYRKLHPNNLRRLFPK